MNMPDIGPLPGTGGLQASLGHIPGDGHFSPGGLARWRMLAMGTLAAAACLLAAACGSPEARLVADGNRAFDEGDLGTAIQRYQRAAVQAPDLAQPYYNAGNALLRQDRTDDALRHLEQAVGSGSDDLAADAAFSLGNAHFGSGSYAEAAEAYIESLRRDPAGLDAKHNLELALRELERQRSESAPSPEPPEDGEDGDRDQDGQGAQEQRAQEQDDAGVPDGLTGQDEALTEEQARQLLESLTQDAGVLERQLEAGIGDTAGSPQDW